MNNRIYPKSVFEKALREYKDLTFCPECLGENLEYIERGDGHIYVDESQCKDCLVIFKSSLRLNKQDIRDKKLDKLLKK